LATALFLGVALAHQYVEASQAVLLFAPLIEVTEVIVIESTLRPITEVLIMSVCMAKRYFLPI
jgi:hypothetical protein